MKTGRRAEPRITDASNHPTRDVCLRVGAQYLDIDERTLRSRIEAGAIAARRDGKSYRIPVQALVRYNEQRAEA